MGHFQFWVIINENENYRTKKFNNENKSSMDRLSSRIEMTKNRTSELEDRSIKFTQLEQREKEKNRVSGTCEMITKTLKLIQ